MRKIRTRERFLHVCTWLFGLFAFHFGRTCTTNGLTFNQLLPVQRCRELCQHTLMAMPATSRPSAQQRIEHIESIIADCVTGCEFWNTNQVQSCVSSCKVSSNLQVYTFTTRNQFAFRLSASVQRAKADGLGSESYCTGCYIAECGHLSQVDLLLHSSCFDLHPLPNQAGYEASWIVPEGMDTHPGFSWIVQIKPISPSIHSSIAWTTVETELRHHSNGSRSEFIPQRSFQAFVTYEVNFGLPFKQTRQHILSDRFDLLPLKAKGSFQHPARLQFEAPAQVVNEDHVLLKWSEHLLLFNNSIRFIVEVLNRVTKVLFISEKLNRSYYLLAGLEQKQGYEATVKAIGPQDEILGTSSSVTFELHEFRNRPQVRLIYANATHVSAIADLKDFLVTKPPTQLYVSYSSRISAIAFGEEHLFVALENGRIYQSPAHSGTNELDDKLAFSLSFPVTSMTFEEAKRHIIVASKNKIMSCSLAAKRCETAFQGPEDVIDVVADSANGYLYVSMGTRILKCPLVHLNYESCLTVYLSSSAQPMQLAIDYGSHALLFNYNRTIYGINLFTSSVSDIRSDKLLPGSKRAFDNVVTLGAHNGRIYWLSTPCAERLAPTDNSCLFSEEVNPTSGSLNLNNFILPPGHGELTDLLLSSPSMWHSAPQEWRELRYEVEITDNDNMIFRKAQIMDTTYMHTELTAGKRYLCKVRTCIFQSICSTWVEASGNTFKTSNETAITLAVLTEFHGIVQVDLSGAARTLQPNAFTGEHMTRGITPNSYLIFNGSLVRQQPGDDWSMLLASASKVKAVAYEPIGQEIYWSNDEGIFRQSLRKNNPLQISAEARVQWLKLLPRHGIVVAATIDQVFSIYLTGERHHLHFACNNPNCSVLGLAADEQLNPDDVFYAVRNKDRIELRTSSVVSMGERILAKTESSENLHLNVWENLRELIYLHGKVLLLTSRGDLLGLEDDLRQVSIFPLRLVRHVVIVPTTSPYEAFEAPKCCLEIGVQESNKMNPVPTLYWNDSKRADTTNSSAIAYYNVTTSIQVEPNAGHIAYLLILLGLGNGTLAIVVLTERMHMPLQSVVLGSDKFTVDLTEITLWQRRNIHRQLKSPSAFPETPQNLTMNVAHVRSPSNITAEVRFAWSEPSWNGQPKSYKVYCWKFEANSNSRVYWAKGTEIDWRTWHYYIKDVPRDTDVYCQVSVVNFGKGESKLSHPISISTSESSPAPTVLLVTSNELNFYDLLHRRELAKPVYGHYEAVTYGEDCLFALRSESDGYSLVKLGLHDFVILKKMSLLNDLVEAGSLTYDWVGRRVLLTGRSRKHFHLQGDGIWTVDEFLDSHLKQLLSTQPGYAISDIAYDPFESVAHFLVSFGGKHLLKSWREGTHKLSESKCDISSGAFALRFLEPSNNQPLMYVPTKAGIASASSCDTVVSAEELSGIDMSTVNSLSFDQYNVYVVSGWQVFVFNRTSKRISVMDFDQVKQVRSVSKQYQPMPDLECLILPEVPENLNVSMLSPTSVTVSMSFEQKADKCRFVTTLPATYELTLKPVYTDLERCEGCIHLESETPLFTVDGLRTQTEYEVITHWWNGLTPRQIYTGGLLSQYTSHLVLAENLEALTVAPDKVQLFWMPPELSDKQSTANIRYQIAIQQGGKQISGTIVSCNSAVCSHICDSLEPSSVYFFQVYAIGFTSDQSQPVKPRHIRVQATTYGLPGQIDVTRVNISASRITFQYNVFPNPAIAELRAEYRTIGDNNWRRLHEEVTSSNKSLKVYVIDDVKPSSTYLLRVVSHYVTPYNYANKVYNLKETFVQLLPPASTEDGQNAMAADVTIVETVEGKYLKWNVYNEGILKFVSAFLVSFRSDQQTEWIKVSELPATTFTWQIPSSLSVHDNSAFKVDALFRDGNTSAVGYWAKPSEGMSTSTIALIIFASILLAAIAIVVVICNVRRRRLKPKPAKIKSNMRKSVETKPNSADVLGQIPVADVEALPHILRNCISIKRELGHGAFGEVYEGLAYNLPKFGSKTLPVAVKTLRPNSPASEKIRFIKEAILMSRFDHPNVVALRGVCFETEPHWIILELMEAGDLLKYLRSVRATDSMPSQVSLKDLLSISTDVACGCTYLESIRHVHRDIAARNCLITSRNPSMRVVKIGDFGLTRDLYEEDYYRVEGQGLLPVRWMAPESMIDGIFTTKSDVWSFGVLLWEVVTLGRQPYAGRSNWEVLNHVRIGGRLERPDSCPQEMYAQTNIHDDVTVVIIHRFDIMMACWSFEANDRPTFDVLLNRLLKLREFPEYQSELPFPQFGGSRVVEGSSSGDTEQDSNKGRSDETVQVSTTRSSARFLRNKNASSMSGRDRHRGSSLRLLKRKRKEPVPRPPSKEEINMPPVTSSFSRPPSQVSSSGTESIFLGSDAYEVPLIRSLQNSARENERIAKRENEAGHRNWALDVEDSGRSSEASSRTYDKLEGEERMKPQKAKAPPVPDSSFSRPPRRHKRSSGGSSEQQDHREPVEQGKYENFPQKEFSLKI
ncbi:hypothetical protein M514_06014 [Trichuris suis]|uniref:receptor protein-tyrosine kinase n=1 Tax=Trichuris suis TaxID=68888 RepID=A0A085NMQ8_9BILA|nr:hypothetical protein M514_06014 [Trichuris suis]